MSNEQREKISKSLLLLNRVCKKGEDSPLSKTCELISPEGVVHFVHGIRQFSIEHDLDHSSVCKLINGKLKTHKGWRIYNGEGC